MEKKHKRYDIDKRKTVYIGDKSLIKKIEDLAKAQDRSFSYVARKAIEKGLK